MHSLTMHLNIGLWLDTYKKSMYAEKLNDPDFETKRVISLIIRVVSN